MLFDTHTNLMWYPDHYSDEFVEFAWEAKRAKMKLSQDVYFAGGTSKQQNAFDSRPDQLLEATKGRPMASEKTASQPLPPGTGSVAQTPERVRRRLASPFAIRQ